MDEAAVEVGKPEERLYVFNLPQSGPFLYGFNFSCVHRKSGQRQYKSEVLHGFSMKFTLRWVQEETILPEPSEYLLDMFNVLFQILGVNEDVVEINHNVGIKEVRKNVIHEVLEHGRHICEPKGHHAPFK